MSTTVSYKGQTLATVSNQTKTLLTEGKYLEDNLTLVDVSGGGATLITKNISANGTYNASSDSADGYSQVNVSVPNTYAAGDEGKVVSNGALVAQTSDTVTENDTYDTTLINSLTVNVSGGGGGGATVLDTIQASAVRAVKIDIDPTWFDTYKLIIIVPNVVFSATDWFYVAVDSMSGGSYSIQQIASLGADFSISLAKKKNDTTKYVGAWINGSPMVASYNTSISYLYWYLYTSSRTMTGTFTILGVA